MKIQSIEQRLELANAPLVLLDLLRELLHLNLQRRRPRALLRKHHFELLLARHRQVGLDSKRQGIAAAAATATTAVTFTTTVITTPSCDSR